MKLLWGIFLFLLFPSLCFAQSKKIPVAVSHSGNDSVGQGVAFALKEAIRGSRGFYLVDNDLKAPRITVHLVSVDTDSEQKGQRSAIAVGIVYDSITTPEAGILVGLSTGACSRDRLESCVKNILPDIDEQVERLRTNSPNLWKTL